MTNVNNTPIAKEPKAAEKPSLILSIGSGIYLIFPQFSTKGNTGQEERIKQLLRNEVFSAHAHSSLRKQTFQLTLP